MSSYLPAAKEEAEEPPAKLLDDLFKKTKATPCIYWLPLTDEQVSLLLDVSFLFPKFDKKSTFLSWQLRIKDSSVTEKC